jgi:hypothetical protein
MFTEKNPNLMAKQLKIDEMNRDHKKLTDGKLGPQKLRKTAVNNPYEIRILER